MVVDEILESNRRRVRQKLIGLGGEGDGERTRRGTACLDLDPILIGIPKLGVIEKEEKTGGWVKCGFY